MNSKESKAEFYQQHLNRVSRSFAFCIEELDRPLRDWIGLAYILCRIVDTVEDSLWEKPEAQLESFDQFAEFIKKRPDTEAVRVWATEIPEDIPESEKVLLDASEAFFSDFHDLDDNVQEALRPSILQMTYGMKHFCKGYKDERGELKLDHLQDTNQYCFFVAGVVGELLTRLAEIELPGYQAKQGTLLKAVHFGLYLQKINILKDQLGDLKEGRNFISSRDQVRRSLVTNVENAFAYILEIPKEDKGFRTFCAWSLFLGLVSLPYIDKSWEKKKEIKISRTEAFLTLRKVKSVIKDDVALEKIFRKYISADELKSSLGKGKAPTEKPWFLDIYEGELSPEDFQELGMLGLTE